MITSVAEASYVFDYGDMALKRVSHATGSIEWSFGRRGQGPAEFSNPTDVALATDGGVWVLDPVNLRVTHISPAGEVVTSLPLPGPAHRLGIDGDELLLFDLPGTNAFIHRWTQARESTPRPLTMPDTVDAVTPLLREPRVAVCPGGGVVVGIMWTGQLYTIGPDGEVDRIQAMAEGSYPELVAWRPRPDVSSRRVEPGKTRVLQSLTCDEGRIYVLRAGRSESGQKVVDLYDRLSGSHLETLLVAPHVAKISATGDGRLLAIETDFVSDLVEYRVY